MNTELAERDELILQFGSASIFLAEEEEEEEEEARTVVSLLDVTERKRIEIALQESEERYRSIVNVSPDAIAIHCEGKIVFVNPASVQLLGATSPSDLIGKPAIEFVHPDDREIVGSRITEMFKSGKSAPLAEERFIKMDGTIIYVEVAAAPNTYQGKIASQVILRDITERKRAEEALHESEERFKLVSNATLDVIWDWDLKTNKIWRSENFDKVFGQIENEIEGSSTESESRIHPDDRERVMKKFYEFLSSENELWEDEYRFKRKDGSYAWVLDRGLLQKDDKGNPVRMIGSMWDQTERRVQAELLKSSEEKYRSLVDNALVGVYETNLDGEIFYANEALVIILGFKSIEELKKTKIQERYANVSDREKFINILKAKGYLINYEVDFITLDKQIRHAILSARLQDDRITGMFLDVTDKKKAQKDLLENERRLRSIINSTPLGSHVYEIIDDELILIDANSSANIILGVDHKKLKNKNTKDIFPLLGFSSIADEFKNVATTGKSFTKDFIISGEGLFTGIFEFFAFQIKKNSMALFFRDVSEQKKLELRIQKSEERFKLASQATHDSIWDWDLLTNKVWWSENMNKIFDLNIGNKETDIKKWYELIHPEDLHRVEVGIKEAINGGKEYWSDEYRLLMGDGNYAYALDRGYIIRDKYRKPVRMVGSILDYTEKVRHERDLISAKEKAEEANRLKSGFISAMSHEIRTPLNIMLGYNDLINEMYCDPANVETVSYFNSIKNNGNRLIDTITKILDISRIEVGEFPITLQPIPIKEIIDRTYSSMKILAEKKKLKLVFAPPAESISVLSDTYCLENSLINLINNAIKYSKKGKVEISLKKENKFAVCKIKDEGIGMSEDYQKHLFQTFSQEKVGISRPYEGVGLGLALTKKYCERMQAGIEVQSKQGSGTTVTLKIPLAK